MDSQKRDMITIYNTKAVVNQLVLLMILNKMVIGIYIIDV